MPMLSREELLKPDELQIKKVDIDENNYVYVREMTAHDKDKFEQSLTKEVENEDGSVQVTGAVDDYRAKLLANTVCDDKGNLLLYPEDVQTLSMNKGAQKIEKIVNQAGILNGITRRDQKRMEEMTKNSEGAQSAVSNSDSAKN